MQNRRALLIFAAMPALLECAKFVRRAKEMKQMVQLGLDLEQEREDDRRRPESTAAQDNHGGDGGY